MIYFFFNLFMIILVDVFVFLLYIVLVGLIDFVNDLNILVGEFLRFKLEGLIFIFFIVYVFIILFLKVLYIFLIFMYFGVFIFLRVVIRYGILIFKLW